jgi:hypothetical protein
MEGYMLIARRYILELGATLVVYGLVLFGVNMAFKAGLVPDGGQIPVALLPMLPCLAAAWVILRHIRHLDEFQRKLQFDAVVFAFVCTALLTFGYGFLEGQGLPRLSMFAVWPLMGSLWGVGVALAQWRYR